MQRLSRISADDLRRFAGIEADLRASKNSKEGHRLARRLKKIHAALAKMSWITLTSNSTFVFEITPLHPHSNASRAISGLSVNITTGRSGLMRDNSRAASSPFMTGIDKSRSTKSGLRSATLSIASRPFEASPPTTQSGTLSSKNLMEFSTEVLSSTIRMLFGICADCNIATTGSIGRIV